jgi:hypothetical protein
MHRFFFGTFEVEHALDERGICIGTDVSRVGFPADQHDHGIQNDGLACACFTG